MSAFLGLVAGIGTLIVDVGILVTGNKILNTKWSSIVLLEAMHLFNKSLEELTNETGLDQATLTGIMEGKVTIDDHMARQLEKGLGFPADIWLNETS